MGARTGFGSGSDTGGMNSRAYAAILADYVDQTDAVRRGAGSTPLGGMFKT